MKKQFLRALVLVCTISSPTVTMDTIVMSNNYEPLPHDATVIIMPSKVIANAHKKRQIRLLAHNARLTDFATFLATLETTMRERHEQHRIWLEAQHNEFVEILNS